MMHIRPTLALSLTLTACGPISITIDSGDGDGSSGFLPGSTTDHDSASDGQGSTEGTMDSSDGSTGLLGSDTGDSGLDSTGDSTGDTDEPPQDCVLPHSATLSWCAAAREVAQVLDCKGAPDPLACYQAVAAQYPGSMTALLADGDCDSEDPGCAPLYQACTDAPGPSDCLWDPDQGVAECVARAGGAPEVMPFCQQIGAAYDVICAQFVAYESCEVTCALPCTHGRSCLGPEGQRACTLICDLVPTVCPPTSLAPPWDAANCDTTSVCALPCDGGLCPTGYECVELACWPAA